MNYIYLRTPAVTEELNTVFSNLVVKNRVFNGTDIVLLHCPVGLLGSVDIGVIIKIVAADKGHFQQLHQGV